MKIEENRNLDSLIGKKVKVYGAFVSEWGPHFITGTVDALIPDQIILKNAKAKYSGFTASPDASKELRIFLNQIFSIEVDE